MWKEYANAVGKSVNDLTKAEKIQAEYSGIMQETRHQIGDAAKYAAEFGGSQARAAAETLKLNQAIGGAMVPSMTALYSVITPIISFVAELIKSNPQLAASIISMVVTLAALTTGIITVTAAFIKLKPAIAGVTAALTANPVILAIAAGLTLLVGVITVFTSRTLAAKKAQEDYNTALKEHSKLLSQGINKTQIATEQEKVENLKKLSQQYDELNAKIKEQEKIRENAGNNPSGNYDDVQHASLMIQEYKKQISDLIPQMNSWGANERSIKQIIKEKEDAIREANRVTVEEISTEAKNIAQKHVSVLETQNLINAYKNAKQGSSEWYDAQKKLADQFPQFSSASGIEIDAIQKVTSAQDAAVKAEWTLSQAKIAMAKSELQAIKTKTEGELAAIRAVMDLSSADAGITVGVIAKLDDATQKLSGLDKDISALNAMQEIDINKLLGVKPPDNSGLGAGITAYENQALDSALKIHDHRVRMEELTGQAIIDDLQKIMKAYAKTADERMSLEEKIFDAKQQLLEKEKQAEEKAAQDMEKIWENQTKKQSDKVQNSMDWIARQKTYDAISPDQEIAAYQKVIQYHRDYLATVMKDTKRSSEDKNQIYKDELKFIQDLEDKIYEVRKSSVEKAVQEYIDAKRKQYDTEEQLTNDRLNNQLKALDKEYRDKENALEAQNRANDLASLYEQEKRYQNAATKEGQDKLAEIRQQISDLETENTKAQLDSEKETKQAAIEAEIQANQDKYTRLRGDLETQNQQMLAAASKYAQDMGDQLGKAQASVGDSLMGIIKDFDKKSTDLVTQGMEKLKKLIQDYKAIMESITIKPNFQLSGSGGLPSTSTAVTASAGGITINLYDSGAKIFYGSEDIANYGEELLTAAMNAARGAGR